MKKINKLFASLFSLTSLLGGSPSLAKYKRNNTVVTRRFSHVKKNKVGKLFKKSANQKRKLNKCKNKITYALKNKKIEKDIQFYKKDDVTKISQGKKYTLITIGGILFLVATGLIVKKCLKNKMIPAIQSYVKEIAALSNDVDNNLDKLFEKLTDFCGCVIKFNNKYKKIDDKDAKIEGTTLWRSGFISSILGLISNYCKDYCKHKIDENVYKNFYFLGIYCCLRVLQIPILSDGIWTADLCNSIKIDSKTRDKAFQLSIEYIKAKLANKEGNYKKNLQKIFNPKNSNTLEKILLYDFGTMEAIEKKLK